MERKTFSIMFFIKRTKLRKNQEAPVFLRITVNGERADISIQRSINPDQWNSAKGCAKAFTSYGKGLNEYLDQIRLKLYQCHQNLKFRSKSITVAALKDAYVNGEEKSPFDDLQEMITLGIKSGCGRLCVIKVDI